MKFLEFISGPVTAWLKGRAEKAQAVHVRDLAVINNQARLAQSETDNNHQWEMASLQDKDKGLRYLTFLLFTAPVLVSITSPNHAAVMFENLSLAPTWIVQTWVAMVGGVWGLSSLKNVVPQFISAIKVGR